jgi:hypothetical protein
LTFIRSAWVQIVVPLVGTLPNRVRPAGSADPRTHTRIPYADIIQVTGQENGHVVVRTRGDQDYFFGGGQLNDGFNFPQVSAEIATALSAAGYPVTATDKSLTVGESGADVQATEPPAVSLRKATPAPRKPAPLTVIPGRPEDDAAACHRPAGGEKTWSALRAVAFGTSGALLGAAASATFVVVSGTYATVLFWGLGLIVAMAVGFARPTIRPLWVRAISVSLTLLGLLLSEYATVRHFSRLNDAPLLLSLHDTVSLIHNDLASNTTVLWFSGLAVLTACSAPAFSDAAPTEPPSPREDTRARRRLWQWITGRGVWLTAAASGVVGLVTLVLLAGARIGVAGQDLATTADGEGTAQTAVTTGVFFAEVKTGDCYNDPPGDLVETLPEVACEDPHDGEVFYIFTMPTGKYPGDNAVDASADRTCGTRFARIGYQLDVLDFNYFTPTRPSWQSGERSTQCTLIGAHDEKLNQRFPTK